MGRVRCFMQRKECARYVMGADGVLSTTVADPMSPGLGGWQSVRYWLVRSCVGLQEFG